MEELRERSVNFRSLTDSIDTSTPMGHIMGALAEMERELIVERTRAGLEAARAQAGRLMGAGIPRQRVAIIYDVGLSTLYRKFPSGYR
ncbi:recombinase family protein [Salmonella enterica subsp. enterica serovar Poona]|nr:recombinase family protein [Salmonella enterica subsp. enterica serovar Poona]